MRIILTEEMLGTASANPDIHREYIASKVSVKERVDEEMAALSVDELQQRSMTVFPRDEDGCPLLWNYQIKGFLKEACGALLELDEKEIKVGKTKLSKWTHKRIVDNYIFVEPRKIRLEGAVIGSCVRPLRADTMRGERVSLAASETVPAGTVIECQILVLSPSLKGLVESCLDYGSFKGLGQWRNSGKGRFVWEEALD